jgi:hypothetical protein
MSLDSIPLPSGAYWALGLAASATLLVAGRSLFGRRARTLRERVARPDGAPPPEALDQARERFSADRRREPRRDGPPTPVLLTRSQNCPPGEGVVVDRSSGGLCLAADRPYLEGAALFLRPERATAGFPWVEVVVRHCRGCRDYYLVGVEFFIRPERDVMAEFG